MTTLRSLTAATVALAASLALAGCGEDSASESSSAKVTLVDWGAQGGPRPWATPGNTPGSGNPQRKAVVMPKLALAANEKGNVPTDQWPDAKDLLTQDALKAMFPDGKDFETTDCGKGSFDSDPGRRTEKNSACTYAVSLPNDKGGKSKLRIGIRAAGADDSLTSNYEAENGDLLSSDRGKDSSVDRVWKNGAWGAKRLVKSSSEYRLVVSDGKTAIYYVVSFDGFSVFGQAMSEKQRNLESQLLPVVVQDLAWRLPAS